MKGTLIFVLMSALAAHAHSGRTDSEGCHAGSQPRHCHGHGGKVNKTKSKPALTRNEADYNAAFCATVGGQTEVRHSYSYPGGRGYVIVDCETDTYVYEGGLDKRSSLDSVQQALFFGHLTGKIPAVVIYDTDGVAGKYEHRIRVACEIAGVEFIGR